MRGASFLMPLDLSQFLSQDARNRPVSAIRGLLPLESRPGMISLLAGKPNPDGFPFESVTMTLKPSAEMGTDADGKPVTLTVGGEDMKRVLQYGSTSADPSFDTVLQEIISRVHQRKCGNGQPDGDFTIAVGSGSQDLLVKAMAVIFDERDTLLVEAPVYPYVVFTYAVARFPSCR